MFTFCILLLLHFTEPVTIGNSSGLYQKYAVSSELPEASKIGVKILEKGGNAVDAAIGVCIAVGIVNAFSSGIGGGGFALVKKKGENEIAYTLDFREKSGEHFIIEDYIKDKNKRVIGGSAVGVPAEIRGLKHLHDKFGKIPWKDLFIDCIELCKGFVVSKELKKRLERHESHILNDAGLKEIYSKNGILLREGDIVKRLNYMKTLELVSKDPELFYKGSIAKSLINSIKKNGGHLTENDFLNVRPIERKVISEKYKNYTVYTTPLPSSGTLVIAALKLLEKYSLDDFYNQNSEKKARHVHLLVEILKFVMARRGELGDPRYLPIFNTIAEDLYSQKNIDKIYKKLNIEKTLKIEEYNVNKYNVTDSGTTHINVIDQDGLAISLTSTINLEWGAKFMDPETGIILNNQIDDFYFPELVNEDRKVPNIAGPNKIPLSSASPIILENQSEMLILGAAGGIRIPTSIIEVLFWLSLDLDLKSAIEKPRLHHQLDPNILYVEWSENNSVMEYLKSLGHVVEVSSTNSIFTSVQGIIARYNKDNVSILAVSDPRKGGQPAGK